VVKRSGRSKRNKGEGEICIAYRGVLKKKRRFIRSKDAAKRIELSKGWGVAKRHQYKKKKKKTKKNKKNKK